MANDQMREAWLKSGIRATAVNYTVFRAAWYAAHTIGFAAGMERAAGIVDGLNDSAGDAASYDGRDMYPGEQERMQAINACADAIRAEIKGDRNA